ncbi:terpenoid synthase [Parathielavia appendiculata]|uniref:Terpenoid synthase n=1 Tax=Parathielavia appendiculata TaxID=2587402 RepID=A0AAN6TSE2_9PEZI|nr:terpenoid synthase [Parathielavia appendiculata]
MDEDERTAETLDLAQYATHGFCQGYPLKRHRYETLDNAGCYEARRDWAKYIGPAREFGGCNPFDGNFTSLVLPLCKPERLKLIAYIIEYAFIHDTVVEGLDSENSAGDDEFTLGKRQTMSEKIRTGRKQLQAKMIWELNATDKVCAAKIMDTWKTFLSTTIRDKEKDFADLEEYLDFRNVDCAAYWVEACMLFGMGMTLTEEEDALFADIKRCCFASLALSNDWFSFDREWAEAQNRPSGAKLINAVWLFMRWRGVSPNEAKQLVREATNRYEHRFLELCDEFRRAHPQREDLHRYLRGLTYQISGNVVWSLRCPRYYPEFRYDPNAGLEDAISAEWRAREKAAASAAGAGGDDAGAGSGACSDEKHQGRRTLSVFSTVSRQSGDSDVHSTAPSHGSTVSRSSSMSSVMTAPDDARGDAKPGLLLPTRECLVLEHLEAPFDYVRSLPSKGVRDTLADALNLWACLPEDTLIQIKEVVGDLHTASLMYALDDIEDGSELRRGFPTAHGVFGVPQTINSASFAIVEAMRKAHKLSECVPGATDIAFEQLRDLHIGQSYDLYWTRHISCPTEEEYLEMVSKKTGGLFRLLSRLMCSRLPLEVSSVIDNLVDKVGIYFQIRDDYENLNSDEASFWISDYQYTKQKGFCEDLDEGKLSFPLVHHLNNAPHHMALQVREILEQRRESVAGCISDSHKKLVLQRLKDSKSFEYTRQTLKALESQIDRSIRELERLTSWENWMLRLCMQRLSVQ